MSCFKKCPKCGSEKVHAEVQSEFELDWTCGDCGYEWCEDYSWTS